MVQLSTRDQEILVTAWSCFKTPPEVDYGKLQEKGGYKSVASASVCYGQVKKKLLQNDLTKLSDRDREILVIAWECFKSVPQVDPKKLQELGGYKTVASAMVCYGQVKNKILNANVEPGQKRKKNDKGEEVIEKPKKRAKNVKATAAVNSDDDVEDGGEVAQAPKKRTKKATAKTVMPAEDTSDPSLDCNDEVTKPIKQEPYDEPVDMSLFAYAAQLLQDQDSGPI